MKVVLRYKNTTVEADTSGFYLFGEGIDEYDISREVSLNEQGAQDIMRRVLDRTPVASVYMSRNILLKCLAEMDEHSYVIMDFFGDMMPVLFRNDEQFFAFMPANKTVIPHALDVRASFDLDKGKNS